jgi:coproporphyrinogen III oxidase-like Fe-S oxidoreductase
MFDCFLMGLRLCKEGVSISRVFQQTGLHPKEVWAKELESLFGESLLLEEGDFIRATPRGLRILDSVLGQLLPAGSGGEFTSEQV